MADAIRFAAKLNHIRMLKERTFPSVHMLPRGVAFPLVPNEDIDISVRDPYMCPYCEGSVESDYVWIVSRKQGKVLKAIDLASGQETSTYFVGVHPHLGSNGKICVGENQNDPLAALLSGLNPSSTYFDMKQWLRDMDHDCDEMVTATCENCNDHISDDELIAHDGSDYCEECFHDLFTRCEWCSEYGPSDESYYIEYRDESVCQGCLENRYSSCYVCDEYILNSDLLETTTDKLICTHCADNEYYLCETCELYASPRQWDDSQGCCTGCVEPEDEPDPEPETES